MFMFMFMFIRFSRIAVGVLFCVHVALQADAPVNAIKKGPILRSIDAERQERLDKGKSAWFADVAALNEASSLCAADTAGKILGELAASALAAGLTGAMPYAGNLMALRTFKRLSDSFEASLKALDEAAERALKGVQGVTDEMLTRFKGKLLLSSVELEAPSQALPILELDESFLPAYSKIETHPYSGMYGTAQDKLMAEGVADLLHASRERYWQLYNAQKNLAKAVQGAKTVEILGTSVSRPGLAAGMAAAAGASVAAPSVAVTASQSTQCLKKVCEYTGFKIDDKDLDAHAFAIFGNYTGDDTDKGKGPAYDLKVELNHVGAAYKPRIIKAGELKRILPVPATHIYSFKISVVGVPKELAGKPIPKPVFAKRPAGGLALLAKKIVAARVVVEDGKLALKDILGEIRQAYE